MNRSEGFTQEERDVVEALSTPPSPPSVPAWILRLEAVETVCVFQALRVYLQALSQQPDTPTSTIKTVAYLLEVLKPGAAQAAQVIQGSQIAAPI